MRNHNLNNHQPLDKHIFEQKLAASDYQHHDRRGLKPGQAWCGVWQRETCGLRIDLQFLAYCEANEPALVAVVQGMILDDVSQAEVIIPAEHVVTLGVWDDESTVVPFLTDDMPVVIVPSTLTATNQRYTIPAQHLVLQAMRAPRPDSQITATVDWMIRRMWQELHADGQHVPAWEIARMDLNRHRWHLAETNGGGLASQDAITRVMAASA
jgi:hypothetical protein